MSRLISVSRSYFFVIVILCILNIHLTTAGWLTKILETEFKSPGKGARESGQERESSLEFSFLGHPCDLGLYRKYSLFAALNMALTRKEVKTQGDIQNILIARGRLQETIDEATLNQTCILKGQKPELVECAPVPEQDNATLCTCIQSGVFAALNLAVHDGQCVSPNEAWCIMWDKDPIKTLTSCAGEGFCEKIQNKSLNPFPCDEFGICKNGTGPIAEAKLKKIPTCLFQSRGVNNKGSHVLFAFILVTILNFTTSV